MVKFSTFTQSGKIYPKQIAYCVFTVAQNVSGLTYASIKNVKMYHQNCN